MRRMLGWAVANPSAVNIVVAAVMICGMLAMPRLRRELYPEFELETVMVTVPYPGAAPEEVEDGVCEKIEAALQSVEGIDRMTSSAREGLGTVVLELKSNVRDVQKVVGEIRSQVDRIATFPALAEKPVVSQLAFELPAIRVAVLGPEEAEPPPQGAAAPLSPPAASSQASRTLMLREFAEQIRDDLLRLPAVTRAEIIGAPAYEVSIEISEETLQAHGLTLRDVAARVRAENVELSGGTIRGSSQEVLLRGVNRGRFGTEIAKLPLLTLPTGTVLTVGDLGTVRDEFTDTTSICRLNGRPGLVISVDRTADEDLFAVTDEVRRFVEERETPPGYELVAYRDLSSSVRDRLRLLLNNGWQGLLLVLLLLALFLDFQLAVWVAMGLVVSVLGTCGVMLLADQSLNMTSMFAFLIALGIVVDDGIVIGENIRVHQSLGKPPVQAAIDGAAEVMPSVASAVLTTVAAFLPMMFVSGRLGKFIAVLPLAVISMLIFSLLESGLVLPCHLAHRDGIIPRLLSWLLSPFRFARRAAAWLNRRVQAGLERFIARVYRPVLAWSLRRAPLVLASAAGMLLLAAGFVRSGLVPFIIFPSADSNAVMAQVIFPDGTPAEVADLATQRLERAALELRERYRAASRTGPGQTAAEPPGSKHLAASPIRIVHRAVGVGAVSTGDVPIGSHVGSVQIELSEASERNVTAQQIINDWRQAAGEFAGAEQVMFSTGTRGPAATPIEFKLLARREHGAELEAAAEACQRKLAEYPGVFDVSDDNRPGKWEYRFRVPKHAAAMAVPLADVARTVRTAYFGEEVMRLQRGRHEVRLMVRYPRDESHSLASFDQLHLRTPDGLERPIRELVEVETARGAAEIHRVEQLRSITVRADVDEHRGNTFEIVRDFRAGPLAEVLSAHPHVEVRWEGQQQQTEESVSSLLIGLGAALAGMFLLLTIEFGAAVDAVLVLAIIPFGAIGAVAGHFMMGLPLTLFSIFGLVALSGIVVNDSIVLIDFARAGQRGGLPLETALLEAGCRRFRPILLTSVTTIAGMFPMLLERSVQAQSLIPMAASLCFGLAASTVLVLILVPSFVLTSGWATAPAPHHGPELAGGESRPRHASPLASQQPV